MFFLHMHVQVPHWNFLPAELTIYQPKRTNLFMLLFLGKIYHNSTLVLAFGLEGSYDSFCK